MRIIWTSTALNRLDEILHYISKDNPHAASSMVKKIEEAAKHLKDIPDMGPLGSVHGSRELHVTAAYYIVYRVRGQEIEILTIQHTSRLWFNVDQQCQI
jgi:toxin ParE1/3/4